MIRNFRNFKLAIFLVFIFLTTFTFYLTVVKNDPGNVLYKPFQASSKSLQQVSRDFISISSRKGLIENSDSRVDPPIANLLLVTSNPAAVRLSTGPDSLENTAWNEQASGKSAINNQNDPASGKSLANGQRSSILLQHIKPGDSGKSIGERYLDVENSELIQQKNNYNARTFSIGSNYFRNNIVHEKTGEKESLPFSKESIPVQLFEALAQDKAENEHLRMLNFYRGNIQQQSSHSNNGLIQQNQRLRGDDKNIDSMNHIMHENAQYKQDIRNYQGVMYHSISSTTSTPPIIPFRVQNFAAFNLTNKEDMRHIYTLHKPFPSSESRGFPCIPTRTIPTFTICVYSVQKDVFVSGSLQQSGIWDLQQTNVIQRALNKFPEATFIDVGANIGYFSLLARAMGRPVIAIEPTDASFLRLQEGVLRNKFYDNFLMLKYAISEERTTVVMGEDDHNQGGIAVAKEISGPANISRSVEAITLDDLVNLIQAKEIIIKMDIEGYECKALYSSTELLEKFKVRYIFMEWLIMPQNQDKEDTPCPKANILHTLANMYSMGFKPYSVNGLALDITNSGSWKTSDIYWKPDDSPRLDEVRLFN